MSRLHGLVVAAVVTAGCSPEAPLQDEQVGSSAMADTACLAPPTPGYTTPVNDSPVFDALLEASGYGDGDTAWLDVAAGNFCGDLDST